MSSFSFNSAIEAGKVGDLESILRPTADAICHTLLKLSSFQHWHRVMVMLAFLRAEMMSTVFP